MKNFFHGKLYVEGLKQLQLTGMIFMIIYLAQGFLVPLAYIIGDESAGDYTLLSMNPFIWVLPFLVVPSLVISLFKFLTARNASDFFHSLPFRREGMALSYM